MSQVGQLQLGDVVTPQGAHQFAVERAATIDPRNAAAKTLAAYLRRVLFTVGPGEEGLQTQFHLNDVLEEWPESFQDLDYPVAVITSAEENQEAHNFTPTALEETFGCFGENTVLWKTGELNQVFQVDFWTTDKPHREAIAARLPDVFNPHEDRSGVMLQGPEEYFSRLVRFQFLEQRRADNTQSVDVRERELRVRIQADIDIVHLRQAACLLPIIQTEIS